MALWTYDYAVLRVVPWVEREEFLNAGVVLFCRQRRYLGALVEVDEARLRALAPHLDCAVVRQHLELVPFICAGHADGGEVASFPLPDRFHWLVAPRSTIIQVSAVHSGLCAEPATTLRRLFAQLVLVAQPRPGDALS